MIRIIKSLPIFRTIRGRQAVSLWASRIFEKSGIKRLFGVNLVAAVIFTGVITPEANNFLSQLSIEAKSQDTTQAIETVTKTAFGLPLADFKISQVYSVWHPGLDMTATFGSPVFAIEKGIVKEIGSSWFGYGKYVFIVHDHGIFSLYAHLSEINTFVNKKVDRGEIIGKVGSTGWATGDHLHLEIYRNSISQNPLELLAINPREVAYDPIMFQVASPSATPQSVDLTSVPQSTPQNLPPLTHTPLSTPLSGEAPDAQY